LLNFTKKEQGVILFLIFGFLGGLLIRTVRIYWSPLPETEGKLILSDEQGETHYLNTNFSRGGNHLKQLCISLNKANQDELQKLPGIGPVIAARIISHRSQNGPYHSVEELLKVKGIGEKVLNRIKPLIIVE